MSPPHDSVGPAPDDEGLGRLLAEGLGRAAAAAPVDEHDLLTGARRGAARIRRRRRAALGVAAGLVLVAPVGLLVSEVMPRSADVTSAGAAPALDSAPGSASEAERAAAAEAGTAQADTAGTPGYETASTDPPSALVAPAPSSSGAVAPKSATDESSPSAFAAPVLPRTAAGRVVVPDGALLTAADLPRVALSRTSDTANRSAAPSPEAVDTCGVLLEGPPSAGDREVVLERRTGGATAWWLLGDTVRVFAGDGARTYLAVAIELGCLESVDLDGVDEAVLGRGAPDPRGRVHWYGLVRIGRVVGEVRLVVPANASIGEADGERLLQLAAERLTTSGLAEAAGSDASLG